jgi:BirA family biotin operon repressor/biotin-[acetyl-CoA-carboxylase] ligase
VAADPQNSEQLVLAFLAEAGDQFVSGEAISDKLGLTRAAVWKHVEALRAQGYRIDAVPARGYRLAEVPDRLTALELRPLLNTHDVGQVIHWYEELGSTSDRAKELADEGAEHGEVVIAEAQTAGRGRRGRHWASPPRKNLYFSVVLRPELPPGRVAELTLVASVALCDAVRQAGVEAGIKWPNDLLVSGRKIAGILTELAAEPDRVHWVVLGAGINVNARAEDFPEELRGEATSIALERGQPAPRALFAAACFTALEEWIDRHAAEGFAVVRDAWRERSVTLGRRVMVRTDGREIVGVAEDIDDAGALLVRGPSGTERILSGDVALLRPAPTP